MRFAIYLALSAMIITVSSCKGDGDSNNNDSVDSTAIDTSLGVDTLETITPDSAVIDSAGYIDEENAISNKIEEEYGEQWDFCNCVVKNDSVNNAILETDDDAQIDIILARMDVIDQHCKEMLTTPNTTPEERAKHERKVKKCLDNAR